MHSDLHLLRQFVHDHSQEAFGELVRRHADLVYSSALRRVGMDTHLAEDVTQDVFTELARKSPALLERPALEGWLYTTSRFKAVDVVRRTRRRRRREEQLMHANPFADAADADWARLRPVIDEALDTLSRADSEILVLRFFRSRSFAEVAQALSLSEDAARMRSGRALERLRTVLAKRGIRSTAEALGLILANSAIAGAPIGLAARVAEHAVSVAKGGASVAGTVLQATNAAKIAAAAATLALLLASAATVVHEARLQAAATAALGRAERENAALADHLDAEARRLRSLLDEETRGKSTVASLQAEIDEAKAKRSGAINSAAVGRQFVAQNAGAPGLIVGHDLAHNAEKYAPLFGSLGLSPDKQAQVLALLARRADLGLTWYAAPDTGSPSASIAAAAEPLSPDELAAQLRDLLGDEGYKAYQDFGRESGAQDLGQKLAAALYATETPLSQQQATQLVQILAQSSPDFQNGKSVWGSSQIAWDSALAAAQTILSGPQLDALRDVRQAEAYEKALNSATNQAEAQAVDSVVATLAASGKPKP